MSSPEKFPARLGIRIDYGELLHPIKSMYGIYANIWGILMVNVTIYGIHGSYGHVYIYVFHDCCVTLMKIVG